MQIKLEESPKETTKITKTAKIMKTTKLHNFASPSTKIDEGLQIRVEEGPQQNYKNYENCENDENYEITQFCKPLYENRGGSAN